MSKKIPFGLDSFNKIRRGNFYYVDKTNFIKDLLEFGGEVNLFTRPRRFGKSLNISMLKAFFEIGTDASLFDGLEISKEKELCDKYLGKCPVISISLKSVSCVSYQDAFKDEIEQLIEGKSIKKEIRHELTYQDLDKIDIHRINLWSMLFTTGYLTMAHQSKDAKNYELVIPNKEIHDIFVTQVREWTEESVVRGNTERLEQFCMAVKDGNAAVFEDMFNGYLAETISIRDTSVAKPMKENFYYGLLLGLLQANGNWFVKSNLESGTGYADIIVEMRQERIGCVFELKYAENGKFEKACNTDMEQIADRDYVALLKQDGMEVIHQYGVACYKKTCKINFL